MGRAEDLTGMAVFLASDEADYIVAQMLQRRRRPMDELMPQPSPSACRRHAADLPPDVARPRYDRAADARHRPYRPRQFPPRPPGLVSAPPDAGGLALDWAILGAGVRPYDAAMREKLSRRTA
jgi:hypothetical protein